MSSTHTLYIKDIQAILQLTVGQSAVSYTLTLRADSGEKVIYNGYQPNVIMDQFMVIDQYVTNPEQITASEEVKNTTEKGVQTTMDDVLKELPVIPENNLQNSHSSITMLFDIPDTTDSLVEEFSPILPSSPTHLDDTQFAQELQDLSGRPEVVQHVVEELTIVESIQQEHDIQDSVEQEKPFNQTAMIDQLEKLRQYTNLTIKQGIIQAAYQHLEENNIAIWQYPLLQEYMMKLFYELLVVHVNDIILRDECIKMLYLVGVEDLPEYLKHITSEYNLLCKVGKHYKLNVSEESLLSYWNWKKSYNGPSLHRWNMMKTYLYQRK